MKTTPEPITEDIESIIKNAEKEISQGEVSPTLRTLEEVFDNL